MHSVCFPLFNAYDGGISYKKKIPNSAMTNDIN